jgi:CBS domain-containing protein
VVDVAGRPAGWLDRANISVKATVKDAMVQADPAEININSTDTLRDALSRMLGLGFKTLPAVDERGVFLGELSLADIESATAEADKNNLEQV